jgi:hypothetical protein
MYHLKWWFLGDCLWHWVSHISNHLHMVQGRNEDDYTPDETPKTPKTPKSARSPNNRINLPKEFPMLGWQNRQHRGRPLKFKMDTEPCRAWTLGSRNDFTAGYGPCWVKVCVAVIWCWNTLAVPQFKNVQSLHACEMSRTAPVDTGVLNETLRNVKNKKGCNNVSVLVHSWIRLD